MSLFFISVFFQASFTSSGNRTDISLDDPNFWQKWAKIAEVEIDSKSEKVRTLSFACSERRRLERRKNLEMINHNNQESESSQMSD